MAYISSKSAFTLIELLVCVAIIALLAAIAAPKIHDYQKRARDTIRISDMRRLRHALETFTLDIGRYPGVLDGISTTGEKIGDNNGPLEIALASYLSPMPVDPIHDGSTYFYAYDPQHLDDLGEHAVVYSFNRAESRNNLRRETNSGSDQSINTADYNRVLYPGS